MLLLRGATICIYFHSIKRIVSIHAPLARSNLVLALEEWNDDDVSIHAPLARSNGISLPPEVVLSFNTCSSCEEQKVAKLVYNHTPCFNTCSSCEEQLLDSEQIRAPFFHVSIHAPLARSNRLRQRHLRSSGFNTCSSCEEQHFLSRLLIFTGRFNTCSSCEEQFVISCNIARIKFQYMLLLRGATAVT